jgi:hypothetical protein
MRMGGLCARAGASEAVMIRVKLAVQKRFAMRMERNSPEGSGYRRSTPKGATCHELCNIPTWDLPLLREADGAAFPNGSFISGVLETRE